MSSKIQPQPQLTGLGVVQDLELMLAQELGAPHLLTVSNGTAALHAACIAAGIGCGDEIIVCGINWGGVLAPFLREGVEIVLVDAKRNGVTIDPAAVERAITQKTRAILAVDLFGYLSDIEELSQISQKFKLVLIEDCSQIAELGQLKGRVDQVDFLCSSLGSKSVFTRGEAGFVATKSKKYYDCMIAETQHPLRQARELHGEFNPLALNYRIDPNTAEQLTINIPAGKSQIHQGFQEVQKLTLDLKGKILDENNCSHHQIIIYSTNPDEALTDLVSGKWPAHITPISQIYGSLFDHCINWGYTCRKAGSHTNIAQLQKFGFVLELNYS